MNKDYDKDREKNKKRKEFKIKSVEKKENISERNKNKQTLREYINKGYNDANYCDDTEFE